MESNQIISIDTICTYYKIPASFISALEEIELIELKTIDGTLYIETTHIQTIERFIRLHFELEINIEGIDVINNLLDQVNRLQEENNQLKNRLGLFE